MKITVWVATNRVGSKTERTITIADEDVEGLSGRDREEQIDRIISDDGVVFQMIEWGWRESDA